MIMQELRCDRHWHAVGRDDGAIRVLCRCCTHRDKRETFHWWRFDPSRPPGQRWIRLPDGESGLMIVGGHPDAYHTAPNA